MRYTIRTALAFALSLAGGYALARYTTPPAPTFTLLYASPYNGDLHALDTGLTLSDCAAYLSQARAGLFIVSSDSLTCELAPY